MCPITPDGRHNRPVCDQQTGGLAFQASKRSLAASVVTFLETVGRDSS